MQNSKSASLLVCLPLGFAVALAVVACGGSDDDGGKNNGGSGGTSSSSAGTSPSGGKGGSTSNTGGSGNGSGGNLSTGVPDDTTLDSLSDDQLGQVCDAIGAHYQAQAGTLPCRLAGMFAAAFSGAETDADARAACKGAYDSCVASPSEETQTCEKPSGECTATIGELEACLNDSDAALQQFYATFPSCETLTLADLMDSGEDITQPEDPASCTALEAKCPDAPTP
jgi:hypothetical protein